MVAMCLKMLILPTEALLSPGFKQRWHKQKQRPFRFLIHSFCLFAVDCSVTMPLPTTLILSEDRDGTTSRDWSWMWRDTPCPVTSRFLWTKSFPCLLQSSGADWTQRMVGWPTRLISLTIIVSDVLPISFLVVVTLHRLGVFFFVFLCNTPLPPSLFHLPPLLLLFLLSFASAS